MWYVDPESLETFLQNVKVEQEQKRVALSAKLKEEYKKKAATRVAVAPAQLAPLVPSASDQSLASRVAPLPNGQSLESRPLPAPDDEQPMPVPEEWVPVLSHLHLPPRGLYVPPTGVSFAPAFAALMFFFLGSTVGFAGGGVLPQTFSTVAAPVLAWQPIERPDISLPVMTGELFGGSLYRISEEVTLALNTVAPTPKLEEVSAPSYHTLGVSPVFVNSVGSVANLARTIASNISGGAAIASEHILEIASELPVPNLNLASIFSALSVRNSAHAAALSFAPIEDLFCNWFSIWCPEEVWTEETSNFVYEVLPTSAPVVVTHIPTVVSTFAHQPSQNFSTNTTSVAERILEYTAVNSITPDVLTVILGEFRKNLIDIIGNSVGGSVEHITTINNSSIGELSDVALTGASNGQVLLYDGSSWENVATSSLGITGGGGTIDGSGTADLFAYWSDTDTLAATSSPTVGYLFATSTATSTFVGGLNVLAINQTGSATSTFTNGINLADGCLAIDGTCITGGSSQWTTSGSDIYYTTGNVGIGTTSPYAKFSVAGQGVFNNIWATSTTATNYFGGNVGVGTASPGSRLTVNEGSSAVGIDSSGRVLLSGITSSAVYNGGSGFANIVGPGGAWALRGGLDSSLNIDVNNTGSPLAAVTVRQNGNVGIGTTSPASLLSVHGTGYISSSLFVGGAITATSTLNVTGLTTLGNASTTQIGSTGSAYFATTNGNVGIGTTTPYSRLSVWGGGTGTGQLFSLVNSASTTLMQVLDNGNIGIGTTSPYAKLSVVGEVVARNFTATSTTATSTIAGGLNVGSGSINYDFSSGLTTIQNLAFGSMSFETDSGIVSWFDMPVTSAASAGTVQSYTAYIDGTNVLTVYGESDGSGGVQNTAVGVGTTTPWRTFSVTGTVGLDGLTTNTGGVTSALCLDANNQVTKNTDNETCVASSERYKHNITPMNSLTALSILNGLEPVTFEYNNATGTVRFGLIAEQVELIEDRLVSYDDLNRPQAVRYTDIIPLLIQGIKDLYVTVTGFANKFTTRELCVEDVCITKEQFLAMLEAADVEPSNQNEEPEIENEEEDDTATTTPPVVESPATSTPATSAPPVVDEDDNASSTPPVVEEPIAEEEGGEEVVVEEMPEVEEEAEEPAPAEVVQEEATEEVQPDVFSVLNEL